MKGMKKHTAAVCLIVFILTSGLITGCAQEQMNFNIQKDGTCTYGIKTLILKSVYDALTSGGNGSLEEMFGEGYEVGMETISGQQYYSFSRTIGFNSTSELQKFMTEDDVYRSKISEGVKDTSLYEDQEAPFSSAEITSDRFIATIDTGSEPTDISQIEKEMKEAGVSDYNDFIARTNLTILVSVTLPEVITESNGINSGKTVTWNLDALPDDGRFIAVTGNNPIISGDKARPKVTGVKNKGYYNKPVTVNVSDNVSVPSIALDGKRYNAAAFKVSNEGSHTVLATDANKNITKVVFTIDTKKPIVKGVKNQKTYKKKVSLKFSDNTGIKSVRINGKKSSTKKVTLKKKQKYTVKVTDKAGNTTTVKFRIKKK